MNRYFIKYFLLFLILNSSFIIHNCFAQTHDELGSPFIRNYNHKEYNAGSQNWSIVQDKREVMYFGNNRGVLEFDGKNWRLIEVTNKSIVLSLAKDRYETIYVGASGEFGYLASDSTGQMTYISLVNKLNINDKDFSYVRKIHATTHGIYFITIDNIFRWFNDTINVIPIHLTPHFGFVVDDEIFVIQSNSGIYIVKNNKVLLLPYSKTIISESDKSIILPYSEKGKILVCTDHNGFYTYNLEMLSINDSIISNKKDEPSSIITKLNTEIDEYIDNNDIYSAVKINNNRYAFATLKGGIIIIDNHGKLVQVINKNRGLQSNSIYNLLVDKNNNLWAALENGISYIELNSPLSMFNELNGLEGFALSNIRYNGKIYASTMRGIYYLPEYKMSLVNDKHNFLPVHNTKSYCWDFLQINNTLLAAGNYGVIQISGTVAQELYNIGNIYCFGQSKKIPAHIFLGLSDGFASVEIILPGSQENILSYKKIKFINNGRFKGINETIRKIISDKNGDIWLTTMYNGIIYLKFKNHDIFDFQITRYDTTHGLPRLDNNYVHYINNNIILGTPKGIYKAIMTQCPDSIKFVPASSFGNIFASDSIGVTQIYIDKSNKIWINSDLGIGTLIKNDDGSYNQYTVPFKRIPLNIIYKFDIEQNGLVWISTSEGLYRYDPKIEKNYYAEFHSIIRKVTINNKNIIFNGTYYIDSLKKNNYYISSSLSQPEQLIPDLDYNNNSITFEYSTTFFEKESANQFKYILEGFDKNWSDWTNETKKEYTNLHEGTYFFKVKAKNIFEYESTEAVYKFTISPPWYRTIVAYIAYVVLAVLLIWLIVKLNTRRLKAANISLEKIVHERTAEILQQKEEISAQKDEIEKQRDIVIQQKQEITDSIIYAKRIQSAVLPPDELVANNLSEYFILYKPRDIVSGDFYWMKKVDNYLIITVADCTGHGVPGAFMSMLGIALLNDIVRYKEISTASQALNELRNQIKAALRQSGKEGEAEDGIDMALCVIDFENMKMQFAGARNPLYIIRNNELIIIKADKMPIGIYMAEKKSFTNHTLKIHKNDCYYMFSDGFIDQFGGEENKRFTSAKFKELLIGIHEKPMHEQRKILNKSLENWKQTYEQVDDITVAGFRI